MSNYKRDKNKQFLDKKRLLIISFCLVACIALIAVAFVTVLKIDIQSLWANIAVAFKRNPSLVTTLFIALSLFFILRAWGNVYAYTLRLRNEGIKVSFKDQCVCGFTVCFLAAVTPANFITDPYVIFWLKTHGLKTYKASAQVLVTDFIWHISQMLITWPSFVLLLSEHYYDIVSDTAGRLIFWLIIIGIVIDVVIVVALFTICFWTKLHMMMSLLFNKIKKVLRLHYHTREEVRQKYLNDAVLRSEVIRLLRAWKLVIASSLVFLIPLLFSFVFMFVAILVIWDKDSALTYHPWQIIDATIVTLTANKFMPIPGAELSTEKTLQLLLERGGGISGNNVDEKYVSNIVTNGILIWRISIQYLPAIIGISIFGAMIGGNIKKIIKHEKIFRD